MKRFAAFLIIINVAFFQGCTIPDPKKEDFIGKWEAKDGATFVLMNDIFKVENLSTEKMSNSLAKLHNKKLTTEGTWSISKEDGQWVLQLTFNPSEGLPSFFFTSLLIAGENGIASNRPPWYLYKYIGDPDDGVMYDFYKSKK